jgi:molecular chaperone GrpE
MKHKNIGKPEEQAQKEQQPVPADEESRESSRKVEALLAKKDELLQDVLLKKEDTQLMEDLLNKKDKLAEDAELLLKMLLKKNELLGKLQRVTADYLNFQKRVPRQIADAIEYEKKNVIKTLLPVLDNLEHTLQNSAATQGAEVLVKGIKIIYDQMVYTLKLHNVEQIKAVGEKFDPSLHEAITQKADPQHPADTVLEELQKGYKLNGQVIRPSRVVVNKLPPEPEPKQACGELVEPNDQTSASPVEPKQAAGENQKTDTEEQ